MGKMVNKTLLVCENCGNEFYNRRGVKFCSRPCMRAMSTFRRKVMREMESEARAATLKALREMNMPKEPVKRDYVFVHTSSHSGFWRRA